MLGVGTVAGRHRSVKVIKTRTKQVAQKASRLRAAGKFGFCNKAIARATIMPAAAYGAETTGWADTALNKLRTDALRAVATGTAGGSVKPE